MMGALLLTRKIGQKVIIINKETKENIAVAIVRKNKIGEQYVISFHAPKNYSILREELIKKEDEMNEMLINEEN